MRLTLKEKVAYGLGAVGKDMEKRLSPAGVNDVDVHFSRPPAGIGASHLERFGGMAARPGKKRQGDSPHL